jgi:hypothetical protein
LRTCSGSESGAAEQLDVGGHQLIEVELVELLAVLGLERPSTAIALANAARVLQAAVNRYEPRDNELAHLPSSFLS